MSEGTSLPETLRDLDHPELTPLGQAIQGSLHNSKSYLLTVKHSY